MKVPPRIYERDYSHQNAGPNEVFLSIVCPSTLYDSQ